MSDITGAVLTVAFAPRPGLLLSHPRIAPDLESWAIGDDPFLNGTVIAIDIGSSSVRAELFDADGRSRRRSFCQVPYLPTLDGRGGVSVEFPRLLAVVTSTLDAFVARAGCDLR